MKRIVFLVILLSLSLGASAFDSVVLQISHFPYPEALGDINKDLGNLEGVMGFRFDRQNARIMLNFDEKRVCVEDILKVINARSPEGPSIAKVYEPKDPAQAVADIRNLLDEIGEKFDKDQPLDPLRIPVAKLKLEMVDFLNHLASDPSLVGGEEVLNGAEAKKRHLEIRVAVVQLSQIVGSEDNYAFGETYRILALSFEDFVKAVLPDLAKPEKESEKQPGKEVEKESQPE